MAKTNTIKTSDVLRILEKLAADNAKQGDALAALASTVQALNKAEEPRVPRMRQSVPALGSVESVAIPPASAQFDAMRQWAKRVQAAHVPGSKWSKADKYLDPRFFAVLTSTAAYDPAHERKVREAFRVLRAASVPEALEVIAMAQERA
jgi:hypothetical protein